MNTGRGWFIPLAGFLALFWAYQFHPGLVDDVRGWITGEPEPYKGAGGRSSEKGSHQPVARDTRDPRRVALVIGNEAYDGKSWSEVPSGEEDAKAVARILAKDLKFDKVIGETNLSRIEMIEAIKAFQDTLGKGDTAFFYYSGHGAAVGDENYLIPTDAQDVQSEIILRNESVALNEVMRAFEKQQTALNVVVLDACRNNPLLKAYGGGIGLKGVERVPPRAENVIAFAAAPGATARAAGDGELSPYTAALVAELPKQQPIHRLFGAVRERVVRATDYGQRPWLNVELGTTPRYLGGVDTPGANFVGQGVGAVPYRQQPSADPAAAEARLGLSATGRRQTQQWLNALGHEAGEADGVFGARTRQALESWQRQAGAQVTGYLDAAAHAALESAGAAALAGERERLVGEMISIPGGCFQMGSPGGEEGRDDDERQHRVCVDGFRIGKTEVTQAQWSAVMGTNPARFSGCKTCPVERVSWNDALAYIGRLNERIGKRYRLPTEAEWEYAARAGSKTAYPWGRSWGGRLANCKDCGSKWDSKRTAPVGSFAPNTWGLHDTVGNVWEWTCSPYQRIYSGAEKTCAESQYAGGLVVRGGSWKHSRRWARSSVRNWDYGGFLDDALGLRLASD